MIVNLKTLCNVSLSEFGKVIWTSKMDELFKDTAEHEQIMSNLKESLNKSNIIQVDLQTAMCVFGPYMLSMNPFTRNTIELLHNPEFKLS